MTERIFGDRVERVIEHDGITQSIIRPNAEPKEEIVRCRDCKHVAWGVACGDYGEREVLSCFRLREASRDKDYRRVFEVNSDGFCAWGERPNGN